MRQSHLAAVMVASLLLIAQASVPAQSSGEVALRAAIEIETVKGDLKAAIEQYKKIAAGSDRSIAVRALLRMAECHQKLGDAEAKGVYERIVRDYADQKDVAVLARARLGTTDLVAGSKGDRPVWTGPSVDLYGTVSPDGRSLTYVDWRLTGNLVLHDLMTGSDRPLTRNVSYGQFGQAGFSAISKDAKQVAYGWDTTEGGHELRVAKLDGTGVPEFRRVFGNPDLAGISPYDWSPDGRWLAVHLARTDLTGQIALVSVEDGTLRVLKSVDWRGPTKIFFSPDGRYIAYDLPVTDTSDEGRVFVLAIDGSRETAVVEDRSRNVIMGWSPDGRQLLFASDRTGSMALWALPVGDGRAVALPRVVKADIGSSRSLGSTSSGTLYVFKGNTTRYLRVASIDLDAGKLVAASPGGFQRFIGSGGTPDWSRNGESLAYRVCGTAMTGACTLAIASVATGQVRELRPKLVYFNVPRWSADSQSVTVRGRDLKGRRGIFRVDAQTGDISPLMVPSPGEIVQWTSDERKIYYRLRNRIMERDLSSGSERELFRRKGEGGSVSIAVSPDGRYIGAVDYGNDTSTVLLIPIAGGEPRELMRASLPEQFDGFRMTWTPDSRAVILPKQLTSSSERKELWLVPVADGRPRKLDIDVDSWVMPGGGFQLRPNGGQIAFVAEAGGSGPEVWALENLLSLSSAKK